MPKKPIFRKFDFDKAVSIFDNIQEVFVRGFVTLANKDEFVMEKSKDNSILLLAHWRSKEYMQIVDVNNKEQMATHESLRGITGTCSSVPIGEYFPNEM